MTDWQRFIPGYMWQNYPTSLDWDAALNHLLDTIGVTEVSVHTCNIGKTVIWTSNWPYAYGSIYGPAKLEVLPKVATRKRLRKAVINHVIASALAA